LPSLPNRRSLPFSKQVNLHNCTQGTRQRWLSLESKRKHLDPRSRKLQVRSPTPRRKLRSRPSKGTISQTDPLTNRVPQSTTDPQYINCTTSHWQVIHIPPTLRAKTCSTQGPLGTHPATAQAFPFPASTPCQTGTSMTGSKKGQSS